MKYNYVAKDEKGFAAKGPCLYSYAGFSACPLDFEGGYLTFWYSEYYSAFLFAKAANDRKMLESANMFMLP